MFLYYSSVSAVGLKVNLIGLSGGGVWCRSYSFEEFSFDFGSFGGVCGGLLRNVDEFWLDFC